MCPSQWEFMTFENRMVYVRYRWGRLTLSIGVTNGCITSAVGGFVFAWGDIGGCMDGHCEWSDVEKVLEGVTKESILAAEDKYFGT